jgi:hypothetical protein
MAWLKCLGTLAYTIVYFEFAQPENSFVHVIGGVVFVLDLLYIYLLYTRQNKSWIKSPS